MENLEPLTFLHLTYKSPSQPSLFRSEIAQRNLFQSLRRYRRRYQMKIHDYFFENFHMEALIATTSPHFIEDYLKKVRSEFVGVIESIKVNAPLYFSAESDRAFYNDEKRTCPAILQPLLDEVSTKFSIERKATGHSARYWIREGNVLHWPIKRVFLLQAPPMKLKRVSM